MKKLLILTSFSEQDKHARILYEAEVLGDTYDEVDLFYSKDQKTGKHKLKELLLFKYLDAEVLAELEEKQNDYDTFFLYGLRALLCLIFLPKAIRKKCVYQTNNDDVSYILYELKKRLFLFSLLGPFITPWLRRTEKKLSRSCKATLVNSKALHAYLPHSILSLYTSPMEGNPIQYQESNPLALLYVGQMRQEKFEERLIPVLEKNNLKLFIIGVLKDAYSKELIKHPQVEFLGHFGMDQLGDEIRKLGQEYNLFGISLIKPVHKSYAQQEANKDVDYLALGIPILGNTRSTTYDKIKANCGVLLEDFEVEKAKANYATYAENCLKVYKAEFAAEQFNKNLLAAFS